MTHLHIQHRPLQRGAFTGADREALSLAWYSRHQRPLYGIWQGNETFPCSLDTTHMQECGG